MQPYPDRCPTCNALLPHPGLVCPLACGHPSCKPYFPAPIDTTKTPIVWVIGPPYSGKTTLTQALMSKLGFIEVNSQLLVLADANSESERSRCLKSALARGVEVPIDVHLLLIQKHIVRIQTDKGFVFDGFPVFKKDAKAFEKAVAPVTAIFYTEAMLDTLVKRAVAASTNPDKDKEPEQEEIRAMRQINRYLDNNNGLIAEFMGKVHRINTEEPPKVVIEMAEKILISLQKKPEKDEGLGHNFDFDNYEFCKH